MESGKLEFKLLGTSF